MYMQIDGSMFIFDFAHYHSNFYRVIWRFLFYRGKNRAIHIDVLEKTVGRYASGYFVKISL